MIVKIPATRAGIAAMEEATYLGISDNSTVSFTVPQAEAAAEAIERGLRRREAEGLGVDGMGPVCTIMVGRLDDWMKVIAERDRIAVNPAHLEWAGVAVFKQAYRIFRERGYRPRLLSAAFRNHMHWSEFIGGDVVISPPHSWQVQFNASEVPVADRIGEPVDAEILESLLGNFADFRRAYEEDGLSISEFDGYGATIRTLRQFIAASTELSALIRGYMLPDPDGK
jgi:transaldolase